MGSLWLNDGGLVLADNALTLCDECPCTGTGTGTAYEECDACLDGKAPSEMEVAFASVVNALCTNCANYNGTFVLPFLSFSGSVCTWQESWANLGVSGCSANNLTLTIQYSLGATYIKLSLGSLITDCWFEKTYAAGPKEDCTTLDITLVRAGVCSGAYTSCGIAYAGTATAKARL